MCHNWCFIKQSFGHQSQVITQFPLSHGIKAIPNLTFQQICGLHPLFPSIVDPAGFVEANDQRQLCVQTLRHGGDIGSSREDQLSLTFSNLVAIFWQPEQLGRKSDTPETWNVPQGLGECMVFVSCPSQCPPMGSSFVQRKDSPVVGVLFG